MDAKFLPTAPKLVDYAPKSEPWAEYQLENGAIMRVRAIVTKVIDKNQTAPDGFPIYQIQCQQIIDMTWPDDIVAEAEKKRGGA